MIFHKQFVTYIIFYTWKYYKFILPNYYFNYEIKLFVVLLY